MVNGSWLMAQGRPAKAPGSLEPCMSHESLIINNRAIHKLFEYLLGIMYQVSVLGINHDA